MSQAANVGDSAALFIDCTTGSWTAITEDHRLTNPRERERLQKMGIQVTNVSAMGCSVMMCHDALS